jgi:hypothetical protein
MFADDTNVLVTADAMDKLSAKLHLTLSHISNWFQANRLVLILTKTKALKFSVTIRPDVLNLTHGGQSLPEVETTKFLGLQIDNSFSWKSHVSILSKKLSTVCFIMRRLYHVLTIDSLKLIYFAHFQSIVKYGIIFWGTSSNLKHIFLLQKRVLRIMLGLACRSSCRTWFKKLDILTVPCLNILSLAMFVIKNFSYFQTNRELLCINTRQGNHLHRPLVYRSVIQRSVIYTTIKVFNKLPIHIRKFQHDQAQFKNALIHYLLTHSFYSLEDFLS